MMLVEYVSFQEVHKVPVESGLGLCQQSADDPMPRGQE